MNTNDMSLPDLITAVNHAAAQSDRWLFIALLVLGVLAVGYLFRWLTGRFEAMNTKLTEVVSANTAAIGEARETMKEVRSEITYCRIRNQGGSHTNQT